MKIKLSAKAKYEFAVVVTRMQLVTLGQLKPVPIDQDCADELDSLSAVSASSHSSAYFLAAAEAAALLRLDFMIVRGNIGRNPDKPAIKQSTFHHNQNTIRSTHKAGQLTGTGQHCSHKNYIILHIQDRHLSQEDTHTNTHLTALCPVLPG